MTKKPDERPTSLPPEFDGPMFFKAEMPPEAPDDRHHLAVNPLFDRPGLNRLGGNEDGIPFFTLGVSDVKEGFENSMRVLLMSQNAMFETDVERRLSALRAVLEFMDSVKDDKNAAEEIADTKGMVLGSVAGTLMARREGNPEQNRRDAIDYYRQALQHFIDHDDQSNVTKTKYNLADAYRAGVKSDDRSDGRLALSLLREAIAETSPSAGGQLGLMARLNFASLVNRSAQEDHSASIEEAIVYADEALAALFEPHHRQLRSSAMNTLGALYANRKQGDRRSNLQLAIKYLEHSLEERPKDENLNAWSLTKTNLLALKRGYAKEFADGSLEDVSKDHEALREQRIADLNAQGRPLLAAHEQIVLARTLIAGSKDDKARLERARDLIANALAAFGERGAVAEMVEALCLLHHADLKLDDRVAAAFHGYESLVLSEHLEAGGVELERAREISESLKGLDARVALLFLSMGETATALEALELGRTRFLRSALRLNASDKDFRAAAAQARAKVIALEYEIARSGSPSTEQLEAFVQAREELAALKSNDPATGVADADDRPPGRTWHVVERLMRTYRALIVPIFGSGRHAIAVLAMNGEELRASVVFGETDLGPVLERWSTADWDEPAARQATVDKLMTDLWDVFGLSAVQGLMRREVPLGSRIAIVPQGEFGQLPLAIARHLESGAVLGDIFEVTIAPSIAVLDRAVFDPEVPTLAAVLDPTEDLPFAPVEAINSRAVFNSSETAGTYLIGAECARDPVLSALQSRSHWLFSAHGKFDPVDARRSGLQLARGDFLSLDDLLTVTDLNPPRLVMLSSCDTGHHSVGSAADEFVGLPLGFLQLGAGAVLATRWPVSDVATALFVSAFMTSHILRRNRPSFALQDAQHWVREATVEKLRPIVAAFVADGLPLKTRAALQEFDRTLAGMDSSSKIFAHPYYWGGFVLYGG